MPNEPEEPKLIIDEDWKSQVERERKEAEEKKASGEPTASESAEVASTEPEATIASESETPPAEQSGASGRDIPPASMPMLVTSLATQAMASMGQIPGDDGKPMQVNLDFARHFIDLIGLLEEKTKGNLTEEESKYLSETLHQIRMMFVAVKSQQAS